MILDAVQSQRNVINVSYYDTASDKIQKGSLSIPEGEPLVWSITNPEITNATITIDFMDPIVFDNLLFDFSIATDVQCLYSRDGFVWNQFNYFIYNVMDYSLISDPSTQQLLETYAGQPFKVDYIPIQPIAGSGSNSTHIHNHYTLYNPVSGKAVAISSDDYQTLAEYLDQSFTSGSNVRSSYVFRVTDPTSGDDVSIYDDLHLKHIQLRVRFDITESGRPFTMNQLQVLTPVDINIDDTYLTAFSSTLFKQSYFNEYPFIPSIANTFFSMLESSSLPQDQSAKLNDLTVEFAIDATSQKVLLSITPALDADLDAVFVWTVGPTGGYTKFVYTSIQEEWTAVNNYLANKLGKIDNLHMEFAICTNNFSFRKTIEYDLTRPHTGYGWIN